MSMSSATNQNRGPLENEFQHRMRDAEASPSPDLWARIDHDLTIQESKHYKERMVFYRQLAAACFVLFILAGALLTYHFRQDAAEPAAIASVHKAIEAAESNTLARVEEKAEQTGQVEETLPVFTEPAVAQRKTEVRMGATGIKRALLAVESVPVVDNEKGLTDGAQPGIGALTAINSENELKNTLGTASDDTGYESSDSKTAFESLRPFYQTARQAIAAVPPSYNNFPVGGAGIKDSPGQARSIVELSRTAQSEIAKTLKRSEDIALALNNSAGKEEDKANADSRWTLGMSYAPSYFNQNIGMPEQMMNQVSILSFVKNGPDRSEESSVNMEEAGDEFERNTDPAFSYAVEAKAGFRLGKKLKLLSGFGFTQNTSRTKSSYLIEQFWYKPKTDERVPLPATTVFLPSLNNNFSTDSLSVSKTDEFYVHYRYRHVTLPLGLQYEGNINKDWFWYAAGGAAANFLVETTVLSSNDEVKDVSYGYDDESPFRKVQFSGNVSLGVGKRLAKAVSVTAGPEFRGYFNSLLAEPEKALAPQGRPYTFGVNLSVNYDLGHR